MSLNLGLESLGFSSGVASYEQVLESQIAAMESVQSFEHAMFDLANTAKDVRNFNEIIDSLGRHCSQECIDFASELLGVSLEASLSDVKLADNLQKTSSINISGKGNVSSTKAAASKEVEKKEEKAKNALGRMWDRICDFFKKIWEWMKRTFGRMFNVASLVDDNVRNPKVKVTWTIEQLRKLEKNLDGIAVKTVTAGTVISGANLKGLKMEAKNIEVDLAKTEEAKKYLRAMLDLQGKLFDISSEIRQKLGYVKQSGAGAKMSQAHVTISRILMKIAKTLQADANRLQNASHAASLQVSKSFAGAKEPEKKD